MKAMADTLRLHARSERPTFQQLHAVGMAIASATGATLFRRPGTFDVDNPSGYFVSEILRNLNDDKELKDWAYYHSATSVRPPRVSGHALTLPIVDLPAFPGPNLNPAERWLGGAKALVDAIGVKL